MFRVSGNTRTTPPRRTLAATAVLLIAVSSLAATMTWHRTFDALGIRVQPSGWALSFRPPRGFREVQAEGGAASESRHFLGLTRAGTAVVFVVWRLDDTRYDSARQAGAAVLRSAVQGPVSEEPASLAWTKAPLGPLAGTEVRVPELAMALRAAAATDGIAYAVTLHILDGQVNDRVYKLFDLACRSIELVAR